DIEKGYGTDAYGAYVTSLEKIPCGHKIAIRDISAGEQVVKYGTVIGTASENIPAGSHVHTHNLKTTLSGKAEYIYEPSVHKLPHTGNRNFMGYKRKDGRIGIRNELWIIPTVGCVNEVARKLAENNRYLVTGSIDGLYCFTHPYGCSQMGNDLETTKKILASLVRHPNAGGVLVLSLGCENLTQELFKEELGEWDEDRVKFLVCRQADNELEEGRRLLAGLSDHAKSYKRDKIDASHLIVGLKCGGSDGLSGVTANPVVGRFSDLLISMGGSTVLTEVPEMFGAEMMLFDRCRDRETFDKAVCMVNDFKKYFTDHGQVVYENPSPGNKAGGITTLEDKSCGCIQKGGNARIEDVLKYGEAVKARGLSLMSGPGNDLVSTTGLTAAGVHMILFTTGRGTPFGAPVPTLKISSNTELYTAKRSWIDINAGTVAQGAETMEEAADRLLELVIATASGKYTAQEINGYRGIAILKDGVTM
ncbi:MAG: altronate dehydratase, partial [Lachnospiraceae bacterium]|nr:altronate dehydratase [Lachnospiraceae bacterium]